MTAQNSADNPPASGAEGPANDPTAAPATTASAAMLADVQAPDAIERGQLTYNDYLQIPELLKLQVPQSEPAHHDEMLFIIIHQAYELWFKLILHELTQAIRHMETGEPLQAHHFISRVVEILRVLVKQIHLVETMRPIDFLQFRHRLMPASGFQSVQFRELEFLTGLKDPRYIRFFSERPELQAVLEKRLGDKDLRAAYCELLAREGFAISPESLDTALRDDPAVRHTTVLGIRPIYQEPANHLPLYLLLESLISLDEQLNLWREHHVRVVARVIGWRPGTGGSSGVDYLRATTTKRCFPELWEVRTSLRRENDDPNSTQNDDESGGDGCPMGYG
jgi:tryptophan 2,3-dioxygenase